MRISLQIAVGRENSRENSPVAITMMISTQVFYLLFCTVLTSCHDINNSTEEVSSRGSKLLNVFSVVKFPNSACNSTGGNYYGTCYTATECASLGESRSLSSLLFSLLSSSLSLESGGTSSGACAQGFGVCCTLTGYCGGSSSSSSLVTIIKFISDSLQATTHILYLSQETPPPAPSTIADHPPASVRSGDDDNINIHEDLIIPDSTLTSFKSLSPAQ